MNRITAALALLCLILPAALTAGPGGANPGAPVEGGKVSPDGKVEIVCDLPESQKFHNRGGSDGSGLCVFASITWAARYQHELRLVKLFDEMRKEPGGGYPEKVDKMIEKYGAGTPYLQDTSGDVGVLKAALATGRMPCITYDGHDPHYGDQTIAHMICLVYLDDQWACVSDNNYPGSSQFIWMAPAEFVKRWKGGGGGGWTVILLAPPPPPVPHN